VIITLKNIEDGKQPMQVFGKCFFGPVLPVL